MIAATTADGLQLWFLVVTGMIALFGAAAGIISRSQIMLVKSRADELETQLEKEREDRQREKLAFEMKLAAQQAQIDVLTSKVIEAMGDKIAERVLIELRPHLGGVA